MNAPRAVRAALRADFHPYAEQIAPLVHTHPDQITAVLADTALAAIDAGGWDLTPRRGMWQRIRDRLPRRTRRTAAAPTHPTDTDLEETR